MKKMFEILAKAMEEEEVEMTDEEKKELSISLKLMEMAATADDDKIEALGMSIDMLSQMQGFTPFELTATCACLIAGAVKEQMNISDRETAEAFYKHILSTLEGTIIKTLGEESDGSEDGDCSCKC